MTSPGLRERKKQKTRWSIQEHALRLFQKQGYDQTTVDQIAAAAEISPSTFFRYFKTKEDVVLQDEYDSIIEHLFISAPADLALIPALRHGLREAFAQMDAAEWGKAVQRGRLMMSVPALRMRLMDNMVGSMDMIGCAIANRTGRAPDDPWVRARAGALIGAMLAASFAWLNGNCEGDLAELVDSTLTELESGLN
jgi:AcrR family transcriptional regulator